MLLEILKNSVRATIEYALKTKGVNVGGVLLDDDLPPVRVYVYNGPYQTIFRISDQVPPRVRLPIACRVFPQHAGRPCRGGSVPLE